MGGSWAASGNRHGLGDGGGEDRAPHGSEHLRNIVVGIFFFLGNWTYVKGVVRRLGLHNVCHLEYLLEVRCQGSSSKIVLKMSTKSCCNPGL